jgi:hypothetical protein
MEPIVIWHIIVVRPEGDHELKELARINADTVAEACANEGGRNARKDLRRMSPGERKAAQVGCGVAANDREGKIDVKRTLRAQMANHSLRGGQSAIGRSRRLRVE